MSSVSDPDVFNKFQYGCGSEKLIVSQLVNKFSVPYADGRFIFVSTTATTYPYHESHGSSPNLLILWHVCWKPGL
jgi:hypothetical protein